MQRGLQEPGGNGAWGTQEHGEVKAGGISRSQAIFRHLQFNPGKPSKAVVMQSLSMASLIFLRQSLKQQIAERMYWGGQYTRQAPLQSKECIGEGSAPGRRLLQPTYDDGESHSSGKVATGRLRGTGAYFTNLMFLSSVQFKCSYSIRLKFLRVELPVLNYSCLLYRILIQFEWRNKILRLSDASQSQTC